MHTFQFGWQAPRRLKLTIELNFQVWRTEPEDYTQLELVT
jgi:hypothetical protein